MVHFLGVTIEDRQIMTQAEGLGASTRQIVGVAEVPGLGGVEVA